MYEGLLVSFACLSAQVDYAAFAHYLVKMMAFDEFVADAVEASEEKLWKFQPKVSRLQRINS